MCHICKSLLPRLIVAYTRVFLSPSLLLGKQLRVEEESICEDRKRSKDKRTKQRGSKKSSGSKKNSLEIMDVDGDDGDDYQFEVSIDTKFGRISFCTEPRH